MVFTDLYLFVFTHVSTLRCGRATAIGRSRNVASTTWMPFLSFPHASSLSLSSVLTGDVDHRQTISFSCIGNVEPLRFGAFTCVDVMRHASALW